MNNLLTLQLDIYGIVQGVGFRPHFYSILKKLNIRGTIQNRGNCVQIIIESNRQDLESFVQNIYNSLPPIAKIEKINIVEIVRQNFTELVILESILGENIEVTIPADLVTCPDCFNEFHDANNRRFHYPFIACTNCEPRYSVVERMPYDRKNTSLEKFLLCEECLIEYNNPNDRRFHAESMACRKCGPSYLVRR